MRAGFNKKGVLIQLTRNRFVIFRDYLLPGILGMLGTALYVLGDTMIVGHGLGRDGLAALNLSIPLINIMNGLGLLLGIGGSSFISMLQGEGDEKQAEGFFSTTLVTALSIGIVFVSLTHVFMEALLQALTQGSEQVAQARDYISVILKFSPFFILFHTLTVLVRNDRGAKRSMAAMLISSIFNVLLDYILIIPLQKGLGGGAMATGFAQVLGVLILGAHFLDRRSLRPKKPTQPFRCFRQLTIIGFPSLLIEWSQGFAIFSFNRVIMRIQGDLGISSYAIIANLSLIFTAVLVGTAHGIQPLISYSFGARQLKHKRLYAHFTRNVSLIIGTLFFMIGLLMPRFLASIFVSDDSTLIDLTANGIRWYFISFLFMGINLVQTIVLQSRNRAKEALSIAMQRGLIWILLGLWIWPKFWGMTGVWLTVPLAEALTLAVTWFLKYHRLSETRLA